MHSYIRTVLPLVAFLLTLIISATTVALVAQAVGPQITTQPNPSQNIQYGAQFSMTVNATGTGPVSYRWYKDGVETARTINVWYDPSASALDAGQYHVVVTDSTGSVTSNTATIVVTNFPKPTISVQPASESVSDGSAFELSVTASSAIPVTYAWRKNGAVISGETSATLSIDPVTLGDAGDYTVVVANTSGSVTSATATVSVNAISPSITTQPQSQTVTQGDSLSLTVSAEGSTPLSYQWYKNGSVVSGATNSALAFSPAALSNAGSYTVLISNSAGSITSVTAIVTVNPSAPVIVTQPTASQSISYNTQFSLTVVATGTGPFTYRWYKDGVLQTNNIHQWYDPQAVPGDAGTYVVTVSNAYGTTTSNNSVITVTNIPKPTITTQPQSQSVVEGSALALSVVATSALPATYQWQKNGTAITGATLSALTIPSVVPLDAGNYRVVVSNTSGSVTSATATVIVTAAPPSITTQPAATTTTQHSPFSLTVTATGTAPLSYQWYKNGGAISGQTTATFPIASAQPVDAGTYTVIVTNAAGSATSSGAAVTVTPTAPLILTQPTASQSIQFNHQFSLTVVATGTTPFTYRWYKGGVLQTTNINQWYDPYATSSDASTYIVTVSNSYGTATSNPAVVSLYGIPTTPPTINTQPEAQNFTAGNTLTLSVAASSSAQYPLSYQWKKGGVNVAGAVSSTLVIASTTPANAGTYTVVVSDTNGSTTSTGAVVTIAPLFTSPSFVTEPQATSTTHGRPFLLSVSATGTAPLSYQWYKNGTILSGQTSATFSVLTAQPTDASTYTAVVTNAAGSATSSGAAVTINPGSPIILTQPNPSQNITYNWSYSISGIATGTAPLSYLWYKDGATTTRTYYLWYDPGATPTDAGTYTVKVSNAYGTVMSNAAVITVSGAPTTPPSINGQPQSQNLTEGNPLLLSIAASSSAQYPLSYQWKKSGTDIPGAASSTFTITAVGMNDTGTYTVAVSDPNGTTTSTSAVIAVASNITPPSITQQLYASTSYGMATSVSALADRDPLNLFVVASSAVPVTYLWYHDGVAASGTSNLSIPIVDEDDAGEYYVKVSNAGGYATSTKVFVSIFTAAPSPLPLPTTEPEVSETTVVTSAYFVSANGNDTWSGTAATLSGTSTGPFKTLARARDAARNGASKRIYVRAGTYFTDGLTLSSADSGLKLMAYPGEEPVLSGGTSITGWQNEGNGVWSAAVPTSTNISKIGVVTVNGTYHEPARYPNADAADPATTGWLFAEDVILQPGESPHPYWEAFQAWDFKYRTGDLSASMFSGEPEPMLFMWDKLGWKSEIYPITVDAPNRKVHVVGRIDFGIDPKTRYYIYNVRSALDIPGEFYFDRTARRLYLMPKGGSFNGEGVVATKESGAPVIQISGANDTLIKGFIIRDQHNTARWGVTGGGGVNITASSSDNVVEGNEITAVGTGIWIEAGAGADNIIRSNNIHHTLTNGITLGGTGGNEALGNHVSHPGLLERFTKGIQSYPVPNRIAYNLVEDTPHYGIMHANDSANGMVIEYNYVRRTNREAHDCGAIYLKNNTIYNPNAREQVRFNIIEDVGGVAVNDDLTFTHNVTCWGIYLDASSIGGQSGTDIYGNIVVGTPSGAVMVHKGNNNNVYNNIFLDAKGGQVALSGTTAASNVFTKNIFAFTGTSSMMMAAPVNGEGTYNNNLYWHVGDTNPQAFFNTSSVTPRGTYAQWKAAGKDANSLVADPQFTDWNGGDFSLSASSPAFGLGFEEIPIDEIGIQGYQP